MKMCFGVDKRPAFSFDLDLKAKTISNLIIENDMVYKILMKGFAGEPLTYDKLLDLFHLYLGGNFNVLDPYVEHILENGFYTPYHSSATMNIILTEKEKQDK